MTFIYILHGHLCAAVCYNVLQYVAVWRSVAQCGKCAGPCWGLLQRLVGLLQRRGVRQVIVEIFGVVDYVMQCDAVCCTVCLLQRRGV